MRSGPTPGIFFYVSDTTKTKFEAGPVLEDTQYE